MSERLVKEIPCDDSEVYLDDLDGQPVMKKLQEKLASIQKRYPGKKLILNQDEYGFSFYYKERETKKAFEKRMKAEAAAEAEARKAEKSLQELRASPQYQTFLAVEAELNRLRKAIGYNRDDDEEYDDDDEYEDKPLPKKRKANKGSKA